jgi:hypothetical protein
LETARKGGKIYNSLALNEDTKRKYTKTRENKNCFSFNREVILDTRSSKMYSKNFCVG